jgi:hypothetical protein
MSDGWPHSEQAVIDEWSDQYFPDSMYCEEIPIRGSQPLEDLDIDLRKPGSQPKRADIVVLPSPTPELRQQIQEYVQRTGTGAKYDENRDRMDFDDAGLFEAVLTNWPEDTIPVRVFEAKQELDYSALGQAIVYSQHLPTSYKSFGTELQIAEAGLIYHSGDRMIEQAAQEIGLSTYRIEK